MDLLKIVQEVIEDTPGYQFNLIQSRKSLENWEQFRQESKERISEEKEHIKKSKSDIAGPNLTSKDIEARNAEICEQRKLGITYISIAMRFGISGSRVRHICDRQRRIDRSNTIIEEKARKKRIRSAQLIKPPSFVIDMGGQDGVLHEWTPEMQAREFGLIE